MSTHSVSMAAACVLLLACAAALAAHAQAQTACTYANTGYAAGVPYHLAVTYLTPGLSDWSIAVPIPPPECANGYVSGEETLVCDFDVQPYVRIVDKGTIIVHRNSWLRGYATVNVTVHCVFPRYAPPPSLPPPPFVRPPPIPNRSKQKSTEATPTTIPSDTSQQSDEYTSSIEVTTMSSDESSSSSSAEEMEVPSTNERVLRMKPSHFWVLPQELFDRFMTFLHGDPRMPLSRRGTFT